jgi:hypothetical protein
MLTEVSGLELHPLPHGASTPAASANVPHLDVAPLAVVDAPHPLDVAAEAVTTPHARMAVVTVTVTTIVGTVVIVIALVVQMTGMSLLRSDIQRCSNNHSETVMSRKNATKVVRMGPMAKTGKVNFKVFPIATR